MAKRYFFDKKAMSLPVLIVLIIISLTLIFVLGVLLSKSSAIFGG